MLLQKRIQQRAVGDKSPIFVEKVFILFSWITELLVVLSSVLQNFILHSVAATKYVVVGPAGALCKQSNSVWLLLSLCFWWFTKMCSGVFVSIYHVWGLIRLLNLRIIWEILSHNHNLFKYCLSLNLFYHSEILLSYVRLSCFILCHIFHFFPILGYILDTFLRCLFQFPNILSSCWVQAESLFQ